MNRRYVFILTYFLVGCADVAGLGDPYTAAQAPLTDADSGFLAQTKPTNDAGMSADASVTTDTQTAADTATQPDTAVAVDSDSAVLPDDTSPPPSDDAAPACGNLGQQCCGGDGGVGGTCATTGGTIGTGWLCYADGQCSGCGVSGNYCCPGNLCKTNSVPSTADCVISGELKGTCM